MADNLHVELVYITETEQVIKSLAVPPQSTIRDVLLTEFASSEVETLHVGIFGRKRSLDFIVQDGDRVELYRNLILDPKEARHQKVKLERSKARRLRQEKNSRKKDT